MKNKSCITGYIYKFVKIFILTYIPIFIIFNSMFWFIEGSLPAIKNYVENPNLFIPAIFFALSTIFHSRIITISISIVDKYEYVDLLKKALEKKNYTIIFEENDQIIAKANYLHDKLYGSSIEINISSNEVVMIGASALAKPLQDKIEKLS